MINDLVLVENCELFRSVGRETPSLDNVVAPWIVPLTHPPRMNDFFAAGNGSASRLGPPMEPGLELNLTSVQLDRPCLLLSFFPMDFSD